MSEQPPSRGDRGVPSSPPAAELPWPLAPLRLRRWVADNRAKAELLLIGGVAIGGIVCMMIVTAVLLIVRFGG